MNPLTLITKGFLGSGDINVIKSYEMPFQIDVDYSPINMELEIEREIELEVKLGGNE